MALDLRAKVTVHHYPQPSTELGIMRGQAGRPRLADRAVDSAKLSSALALIAAALAGACTGACLPELQVRTVRERDRRGRLRSEVPDGEHDDVRDGDRADGQPCCCPQRRIAPLGQQPVQIQVLGLPSHGITCQSPGQPPTTNDTPKGCQHAARESRAHRERGRQS